MSTSRFQELEQILKEDSKNTYNYLEKNFAFIGKIPQKLANYLGCSLDQLFWIDSEGKQVSIRTPIQDSITVDDECFFRFWLLISIINSPFNSHSSGKSFVEKRLAFPSAVALCMAVKQQGDSFIVKAPVLAEEQITEKEVSITPDIDDSWIELLESCFKVMKKILEGGLEERISKLGSQTDNTSQKALGFSVI